MVPGEARPQAASDAGWDDGVRWQRWVLGGTLTLLFFVVYVVINRWNVTRFDARVEPLSLGTPLDERLPVVAWAIWPYLLYYPLVLTPLALVRTRPQMARVLCAYVAATLLAWVAWVAIPVQMVYPQYACSGLSCGMLQRLQEFDAGANIFPSLHAAHALIAALAFWHFRHPLWPLVAAGAAAVTIAAVLTAQHYLLDLPVGIALGFWSWELGGRLVASLGRARGLAPEVRQG